MVAFIIFEYAIPHIRLKYFFHFMSFTPESCISIHSSAILKLIVGRRKSMMVLAFRCLN